MIIKSHAEFKGTIEKLILDNQLRSKIATIMENEIKNAIQKNINFYVRINELKEDF